MKQLININRVLFSVLALNGMLLALTAQAEVSSPFEARLLESAPMADVIDSSYRSHERVTTIEAIPLKRVTAQIRGLGNVTFHWDREWRVPEADYSDNGFVQQLQSKRGVHLQGFATFRKTSSSARRSKQSAPLATTIFGRPGDQQALEGLFFADLGNGKGHYYRLRASLRNGSIQGIARVARISRRAFADKTCALRSKISQRIGSLQAGSIGAPSSQIPTTAASYLSFDLATEADFEFFQAYGSGANTKIQSWLNQVQTMYRDQLGLTFSLVKQVVMTSSGSRYTTLNVENLLAEFRSYERTRDHLGAADVFHLFTGKDTFFVDGSSNNYSVIGLAYVGVVCAYPDYSYGLTENFNEALNHVTVAHEIGHNFNASHDAAGSIMGTVLNASAPPTQFSTNSRNQIQSHVSSNGSCLTNSDGSTNPNPGGGTDPDGDEADAVQLAVSLSTKGRFSATITIPTIQEGCSLALYGATSSSRVFSNTPLFSGAGNFTYTRFQNLLVNRTAVGSAGRAAKVYLGAIKTCGSDISYSTVRSVNASRVRSNRPTLNAGQWLRLLRRQASSATPSQS